MAENRYYWLKLQEDFFDSKRIKKLRKLAGGDTFVIIYLKMQLLSIKRNGILEYTGLEPTFAEELALDIDEEPDNVMLTLNYLLNCGLLETSDNREFFVPYAVLNTGSEGSSAKRMREYRERKSLLEIPESVTLCAQGETMCEKRYGEKEIEKEIEREKEYIERPAAAPTPPKPVRHKRSQYGWVMLSDEEYSKLLKDLGQAELDRCITYVDESAQSSGNKNKWKDWNLVVRKCHREGWGLRNYQRPQTGGVSFWDMKEATR